MPAPRRIFSPLWFVFGALLGLLTLLSLYAGRRDGGEPLTEQNLKAAKELWAARALADYDCQVLVDGSQQATYSVQVRGGNAVSVVGPGGVSPPTRTWEAWTIDGLLGMIEQEWEQSQGKNRFGAGPNASVLQRVHFHSELGAPFMYRRSILGAPGEVSWRIQSLTGWKKGEQTPIPLQ